MNNVSNGREAEIRRAVNEILYEVPEGSHELDVLDAVWGWVGPLTSFEEAFCIERIRSMR